jgi:hypothetical protein
MYATTIEPVLQGKDLGIAQREFDTQIAEYDKIMTVYKNEVLRVQREANLVRSFGISQFGIYNWDRFFKDENSVRVMADFIFDRNIPGADKATVYLVIESRNAVIPYYGKTNEAFSFILADKNKLIAVMPDETVAVFSSEEFAAIGRDAAGSRDRKVTFRLKVTDTKIADNQDIAKLITSI